MTLVPPETDSPHVQSSACIGRIELPVLPDQIITREHFPTFEMLPPRLMNKIAALGQQLAHRMKAVYGVDRVAFLFTGGDVAHVHAHVVPMHAKTDITSARYITSPEHVAWGSDHLQLDRPALLLVREELAFVADPLA